MLAGLTLTLLLAGCGSHPFSGDAGQAEQVVQEYVRQGEAAIPELQEFLKHDDPQVRYRARTALGRITGQWGSDGNGIQWKRKIEDAINSDRPILVLELFGRFDEEFC